MSGITPPGQIDRQMTTAAGTVPVGLPAVCHKNMSRSARHHATCFCLCGTATGPLPLLFSHAANDLKRLQKQARTYLITETIRMNRIS